MSHPNLSLKELLDMPTLHQGHFDNLKCEYTLNGTKSRLLLSRATVQDGAEYPNQVTVEQLINGNWKIVTQYQAE